MQILLASLDLCGAFVFALSGAATGVRSRLDLFGVLVLSFVASSTGGIFRDLLLGATPPPAISDWKYMTVSLVAGLLTFYRFQWVDRLRSPVLILDAAGLGLFAASGAFKAFELGQGPMSVLMLGVLTGIGGGMARDLLVANTPIVLRAELYATAALSGASIVMIGMMLGLPPTPVTVLGALTCFGIRVIAIRRGWRLPLAREIS